MVTSSKKQLSSIKIKSGKKSNKKDTNTKQDENKNMSNEIIEGFNETLKDKKFMNTFKIVSIIFIISFVITWILIFLLRPGWVLDSEGSVNIGISILGAVILSIFVVVISMIILYIYREYY